MTPPSPSLFSVSSFFVFAALLIGACSASPVPDPEGGVLLGKADTIGLEDGSLFRAGNRYGWGDTDHFVDDVLPVFAQRCVTCHGCVDSPCQLKLISYEGAHRGSNETNIFATSVGSTPPNRLQDHRVTGDDGLIDYQATERAWRDASYYSVTDGGEEALMHRLLSAARDQPIAMRDLGPAYSLFDEGLRQRTFACAGTDELSPEDLTARAMPFGLPEISAERHSTMTGWLEAGSPGPSRQAQAQLATPLDAEAVQRWEGFLNPGDDKGRLVARYLYEHMYFAHLHFPSAPGEYYEIVRSRTAAPAAIDEIVTGLANDDPDGPVYYRLRKYTALIVQKSHVAWELSNGAMDRFSQLFFEAEWEDSDVDLPDYDDANPFEYFEQIPSMARARFMIENSKMLIEAMVKSDVCTGSRATYAIRDRFWVWFLDPAADPSAHDPKLGNWTYLHINPSGFDLEGRYQRSFEEELRELRPEGLSLDDLWDGDGSDRNAWITVLRHERSATAHYGAIAGRPETMWVLSYSNFERLYYNLVLNFQASGSLAHKVGTWKYMSRVRTEGEDLWLSLLPEEHRTPLRAEWTGDFGSAFFDEIGDIIEGEIYSEGRGSQIVVDADDPMGDLISQMRERVGLVVVGGRDELNPDADPGLNVPAGTRPMRIDTFADMEQAMSALAGWRGPHAQHFPNTTIVRVHDEGREAFYTVVANRGYVSHDLLSGEERARNPALDVLSAVEGVAGNYPELFIDMPLGNAATSFVEDLAMVETDADWQALMARYASPAAGVHVIQRNHPEFWTFFDALHAWHLLDGGPAAGILDVSEYIWPR